MLAWIIYADDFEDNIVNGDRGHNHGREISWVGKCWHDNYGSGAQLPKADQINAITAGALFPYCSNIKLYRCPTGYRGEMLTYTIIDSMNAYPQPGQPRGRGPKDVIDNLIIKNRSQIRSPHERLVFLDEGWVTPDSFAVYYTQEQWWDDPPVRHSDGTNISFADGHSDHKKWKGIDTIKRGRSLERGHLGAGWVPDSYDGYQDLYWIQKATWGKLGYYPNHP